MIMNTLASQSNHTVNHTVILIILQPENDCVMETVHIKAFRIFSFCKDNIERMNFHRKIR